MLNDILLFWAEGFLFFNLSICFVLSSLSSSQLVFIKSLILLWKFPKKILIQRVKKDKVCLQTSL
jgi:hypothetical protein